MILYLGFLKGFLIFQLIHLKIVSSIIVQNSSHCIKSGVDVESAFGAKEFKGVKSNSLSAQCSLPLDIIESKPSVDENGQEVDSLSTEQIERFILLTSKARSLSSQDEAVDLTEPRFESFCMENISS